MGEINVNDTFYSPNISKMLSYHHVINRKINEIFYILCFAWSLYPMCFAFPEHLIVDQPCFTAQQPCVAQRIRLHPGGKVNKLNSASAWVRLGKAVKTNKLPRFKDQAISPKNSVFWFLLSKPKSSSRATCHRIPFSGAELQLSSWGVGGGGGGDAGISVHVHSTF